MCSSDLGFLEGGQGCFLCGGDPYRGDHGPVGAGLPAMQATRFLWVNRADIIAGKPAPTEAWQGDFWRVDGVCFLRGGHPYRADHSQLPQRDGRGIFGGWSGVFFVRWGPLPGRSRACGSWLACDASDSGFMGKPRRYHRWQASSHRGVAGGQISASNITVTRPLYCVSG